ncbi:MAG: CBS domain-containing protein [Chloroflexi bacterium]|nr:CBS domain-containing protein [Chloroflexota bacterium]MBP8056248.1 CBS domain-containing protein [Chloroflexota bacterium]
MATVSDILRGKGQDVWAVSPDDTVLSALQVMAEKGIGAVLVLEAGLVRGILSERDYARKVVLQGRSSANTPVKEIMTSRVFAVTPSHTVENCISLMTEKRIRHLPVMDGGKLVGVISIGDVVKMMLTEKSIIIDQLTSYITTGGYS